MALGWGSVQQHLHPETDAISENTRTLILRGQLVEHQCCGDGLGAVCCGAEEWAVDHVEGCSQRSGLLPAHGCLARR